MGVQTDPVIQATNILTSLIPKDMNCENLKWNCLFLECLFQLLRNSRASGGRKFRFCVFLSFVAYLLRACLKAPALTGYVRDTQETDKSSALLGARSPQPPVFQSWQESLQLHKNGFDALTAHPARRLHYTPSSKELQSVSVIFRN